MMRAYPFAQPVRELGAAIQTWHDAAHAAFATTAPQLEATDVPAQSGSGALVVGADGEVTFGALLAAFEQAAGTLSLAHLAAGEFALTAADGVTSSAPPNPLQDVLAALEVLGVHIQDAAGAVQLAADLAQAPLPDPVHAAFTARGSPFDPAAFAPDPALVEFAAARCGHCDRQVPRPDLLGVCQAMMVERDYARGTVESGLASGYVSVDGWFFTDTESPAGYSVLCPDAIDVGADVRPLDLRYYRTYVEQFGQAGGPIDSHRRRVRMLEVLRYDPFGSAA